MYTIRVGSMEKICGVGAYVTAIKFQQCKVTLDAMTFFPNDIFIQ